MTTGNVMLFFMIVGFVTTVWYAFKCVRAAWRWLREGFDEHERERRRRLELDDRLF